jgi:hypothetical protein
LALWISSSGGHSLVSPRSLHQILWRRIEKDARNLLKEVDETRDKIADQHKAPWFSTVLTKWRGEITTASEGAQTVWRGFHRSTRVITTTRLIVLFFKISLL